MIDRILERFFIKKERAVKCITVGRKTENRKIEVIEKENVISVRFRTFSERERFYKKLFSEYSGR